MPVQQHPIPQNVTSYQFRLVGDMTLKQFLQLAAGIVIGLVIYATPLPSFFKWPLISIIVGLGAAIAFVPVQGRPLDQWIVAFIRSIYAPTIYVWQKPNNQQPSLNQAPTTTITQALQPSPSTSPSPTVTQPQTSKIERPNLVPQIHTLTRATPPTPNPTPPPQPEPLIPTSQDIKKSAKNVFASPPKPIAVTPQSHQNTNHQSTQSSSKPAPTTSTATVSDTPAQPGTSASFSTDLPIPSTPQTPNTIVGMTLSPQGKILESVIVEILKNGQTIRATKSNKLGQFLFAKPLDDGIFQITADKDGFTFPRFDLKLDGQIIPPIKLQATGTK